MLTDTHCHLEMLGNETEVGEIIKRSRETGLDLVVTIGTDLASSQQASDLARAYEEVYATVGVHPHEAKLATSETFDRFLDLIRQNRKIRGIGETGLDFYYDHSPREIQKRAFVEQIDLARKTGLPVVVHSRNAAKETIEVLRAHRADEVGGVIHCFSENMEMAKEAIHLNFLISFSGMITFKNAGELQKVVAETPLDKILIETDAPFLTPIPYRGKKNEPMYVKKVAEKIAEIKNVSLDEVIASSSENARKVFGITG